MTPHHPDAGGLSVEEIARIEQTSSCYVSERQIDALCAMARQSIQMREALEEIVGFYDNQDMGHVDFRVGAYMTARDALAPTQSGGEGVGE